MRLKVSNVKPGDILIADVYNAQGSLLLPKSHQLTVTDISHLQRNCVHSVAVRQTPKDLKDQAEMLDFYTNAVSSMKTILDEVRFGKNIPVDEIRDISLPLVQYIYDTPSIPAHLAKVRDADNYTYKHSINVGLLSAALGKWLKLPMSQIIALSTAGFLHDIGKTKVPLEILNKPGRLTDDEMTVMKRHTEFGYTLIQAVREYSEEIALTALCHHERLNGTGYPKGIEDAEIPFFARIIMVADIFDAMTSNRVYRKNSSPFKAFATIFSEQFGLLDPNISRIFLDNIVHSFIGTQVRLSNGAQGEVVFINPAHPGRPTVRLEKDIINLNEQKDIEIEEVVHI